MEQEYYNLESIGLRGGFGKDQVIWLDLGL